MSIRCRNYGEYQKTTHWWISTSFKLCFNVILIEERWKSLWDTFTTYFRQRKIDIIWLTFSMKFQRMKNWCRFDVLFVCVPERQNTLVNLMSCFNTLLHVFLSTRKCLRDCKTCTIYGKLLKQFGNIFIINWSGERNVCICWMLFHQSMGNSGCTMKGH